MVEFRKQKPDEDSLYTQLRSLQTKLREENLCQGSFLKDQNEIKQNFRKKYEKYFESMLLNMDFKSTIEKEGERKVRKLIT